MGRSWWVVLGVVLVGCGVDDGETGLAYDPELTTASSSGGQGASSDGGSEDPSFTSGATSVGSTTSVSTSASASVGEASSSEGGSEETGAGTTGVESDCPRVRVTVGAGLTLNVRPDPSTANAPVGSLADGALVDVVAEVMGEVIDGNDLWYEIDSGFVQGFVFSGFAECSLDEPPDIDPNGWYLPLPCGMSAQVTQGNNGALSHNGTSAYAFDFGVPPGTSLVAIADGVVTHAYGGTGPGDPCYNGGGMECSSYANYVTLRHADGTKSIYMHLQSTSVGVGDTVAIGTQVGLSGSTGWSTGRHAHVMRMEDCGGYYCQSVPLAFNDVAGDGVPVSGQMVTSGNCP